MISETILYIKRLQITYTHFMSLKYVYFVIVMKGNAAIKSCTCQCVQEYKIPIPHTYDVLH